MNKIELIGRLTKEPKLLTTPSGKSVCRFTLAVDRKYKQDGQPTADFIQLTAWGRAGETIAQYMVKGSRIGVSGRLQIDSYTGNDNVKRQAANVIVEEFDFLDNKKKEQTRSNGGFDDPDFTLMDLEGDMPF